ncbi:uncharacterized protein LOC131628747 [Vicia villosa]|uniref:uncharacterized protein LOC131621354 n=1 Tax=Vicia villosa TaxID=3911 RepID=UPI00273C4589|nr:uncharacterized protein LOC131621354 [Vicia villosa]XP_058749663.1 uncharacterized protein LOC131622647 [Vicia villosa]XP_058755554.1 uncharacterized protein LOC131628747 [Vicia villosa]
MKSSSGSSSMIQSCHESLNWKPVCHCGDKAILRRATTAKSFGKHFWGCPHYKGQGQPGCGFFEWFYEESEDTKGKYLMSRLEKLDKKFEELQMDVNKIKLSSEEIRKEIYENRRQLNKMIKLEKFWIMMLFIVFIGLWIFM